MQDINTYWYKLDEYNNVISKRIKANLPKDWNLSIDDIKSAVNGSYIRLIKRYKKNPNGLSLTSYCYQYAERDTYRDLMREYKRLKGQVEYIECEEEDEDGNIHHQYGSYQIEPYKRLEDQITDSDFVDEMFKRATTEDSQIMKLIMAGLSYDAIADLMNLSKMEISRRMKKYGDK